MVLTLLLSQDHNHAPLSALTPLGTAGPTATYCVCRITCCAILIYLIYNW